MALNIRKIVRLLTPPIVFQLRRMRHQPFWRHTWQCVAESPEAMPSAGSGYHDGAWIEGQRQFTAELLAQASRPGSVPRHLQDHRSLLPLTVSLLKAPGRPFTILDFGGAMGVDFIHLTSGFADAEGIRYIVVDTPESCRAGRELFAAEPRISFLPDIPQATPDLVFTNGGLQCAPDWRTTLDRLSHMGAPTMLMVRVDAGDVPTHVRGHNGIRGSLIPNWCVNFAELRSHMETLGYHLVFKGAGAPIYDEGNLPETHRIGGPVHLLFRRSHHAQRGGRWRAPGSMHHRGTRSRQLLGMRRPAWGGAWRGGPRRVAEVTARSLKLSPGAGGPTFSASQQDGKRHAKNRRR